MREFSPTKNHTSNQSADKMDLTTKPVNLQVMFILNLQYMISYV